MFRKSTINNTITAINQPQASKKRKRNRSMERMRHRIRKFRWELYMKASALHNTADDLRQDDPDARCEEEIPTNCIPRLRARQIEAIADMLWSKLCE